MKWLILFHVLGATIWAGGHLILSLAFLPQALKHRDISIILNFEKYFERIGLPTLLVQAVTGVSMALIYVPFSAWGSLETSHHVYLWIKLGLLIATLALGIHARLFIIPRLTAEKLSLLALHIILVTMLGVALVITGMSFRFTYL